MLEIRRILCPVDFSDASRHALEHAVVIAGWYGSRITALHVFNPVFVPVPPLAFVEPRALVLPTGADRQKLEDELREWLRPANAAGLQTDALLRDGTPASRILECAKELPADLLVMGTHGHGGFERLVLGSVTEKVLRKASCPVLTVPPPAVATSKLPFTRLVCPVDFSESSVAALRFAFSIAQESGAHLTIVHVFEWPVDESPLAVRSFDVGQYRRVCEGEARRQLDALVTEDVRQWCEPATRLCYGKPYEKILDVAKEESADLIVMGLHGRNVFDLMLFGSTTNQIVRRASCPVLTLGR